MKISCLAQAQYRNAVALAATGEDAKASGGAAKGRFDVTST